MHPLFHALTPLLQALPEHDVRIVGGAVRAYLRHDPLSNVEIDLATDATPEEVIHACSQARIPTKTEAARWGVLTVSLNDTLYEITSLRQDTYLNGSRYPMVEFIRDWAQDAHRRDFTMNAVYLKQDGTLFDPFGGEEDLKHGLVKFIGNPLERLKEDPLRLIRFWRFCAHYGIGGVTPELMDIFQQSLPSLANISRSRMQREWGKLIEAPQAATVIAELQRTSQFEAIRRRL